ncbi:MAG TPA: hypothetical protein VMD05_07940 [Candidatus Nanoarchaeia archaeon]|nr:hypothetical protein [Candidatus Nanoarchaeia archaeon]
MEKETKNEDRYHVGFYILKENYKKLKLLHAQRQWKLRDVVDHAIEKLYDELIGEKK